jgi:hypothetical protein
VGGGTGSVRRDLASMNRYRISLGEPDVDPLARQR